MSTIDVIWAGWRRAFVESDDAGSPDPGACPFCRILASGVDDETAGVVWRGVHCFVLLNAFPYSSGHVLVMPYRHVAALADLTAEESSELWALTQHSVAALELAYRPDGVNVGANLGRAAGAGVPGHVHVHVLPRWTGDTNFMSAVANARVMPESLDDSGRRLRAVWSDVSTH